MNKKQGIVIGVFAATFVALSYLGWAFLAQPVAREIEAKQAELTAAQAKLAEAQSKAAQHDKFQALAENIKRDLSLVTQRVDPRLSNTDLYKMVSSLGNRLGLPDYSYEDKFRKPTKEAGLAGMDEILVSLKFKCDYHHVGALVNAALSQERMVVPDKINLKGNILQSKGKPTVEGEMDLRIFLETVKAAGQ